MKILEVGFGTGDLLRTIASKNPTNFYVGLETVLEAIYSFKKLTPFNLCQASVEKLPFHDKLFDIVICSHVIEHIKDDVTAVSEIVRVLKHNGIIIVAVPSDGNDQLHYRQYTDKALRSLFKKHEYELIYLKAHGSFLTKTVYRLINFFSQYIDLLIFSPKHLPVTSRKVINNKPDTFIRKIYYDIFVPLWLFLDHLDDLFTCIDPKPIQFVGVFKRLKDA